MLQVWNIIKEDRCCVRNAWLGMLENISKNKSMTASQGPAVNRNIRELLALLKTIYNRIVCKAYPCEVWAVIFWGAWGFKALLCSAELASERTAKMFRRQCNVQIPEWLWPSRWSTRGKLISRQTTGGFNSSSYWTYIWLGDCSAPDFKRINLDSLAAIPLLASFTPNDWQVVSKIEDRKVFQYGFCSSTKWPETSHIILGRAWWLSSPVNWGRDSDDWPRRSEN